MTASMGAVTADFDIDARARTLSLSDDDSIREAYAIHAGELYRFARRALGDSGLAEEVVQETFVRAWRRSDRFDPTIASTRTWLFAICRNLVVDMARARSVRPPLAPDDPIDRPTEDDLDRVVLTWQLEEAISTLSDEHRKALVDVHWRSKTYGEVAEELGVPEGTVKSRVYYALKAVRRALEERGYGDA
jgi:RNA polymerase sigma-70 factor (ECF subfamily)